MRYIIIEDTGETGEFACKKANAALYKLRNPNPDPSDTTKYWLPMVAHPSNGSWALVFDGSEKLWIDNNIPQNISQNIMLLAPDAKPQQRNSAVNYINNNKGQQVTLDTLLNNLGDGVIIKTQAEMDAAGWFVAE